MDGIHGGNVINRLQLVATLVEREVMRYTPAGVPIVNCLLSYSGPAVEAQTVRQIEFSIEALAAGKMASVVDRIAPGTVLDCVGFLARKHRSSKTLVFHISGCNVFVKD
ncbi:Primosomal replication protein N [Ralstonia mannitolilytica]|uniref:primosomal replication protein N n=1 Tax=Ralstonia mannitolilytica TaxID=105219 RepID=UPI0028F65FBC|nr:primosomal replication protein N [Ralstonia mannitolilytica]CAJ0799786.1 Primosomal replication protein N [Ralstonia mannitolilytica]CAJ0873015.1 Primosomal replication protein N [Ralstonia mannitolilytica]